VHSREVKDGKIMKHKNFSILPNREKSKLFPIALNSFNFSKRITGKYSFSRKSANLPALIFLRLFGRSVMNKITNINRIESINNYFGLQLSFYVRMINQLNQTLSSYPLSMTRREAKKGDEGRLLGLQKRISEIALLKHSLHNKTKLLSNRNPAMLEDRNLKAAKMYPDNVKLKLLPHEAHMSLWHVKGSKNLLPSHETSAQDASLPTPQDRGSKWNSYHQGKGDNIKFPLPLWERVRVRGREVFPEQKQLDVFLKKMTHKYLPSNLLETTLLTGSRYKSTLPDMIYSLPGENLLSKRPKALRGEPSELIFRKPTMQSNDTVLENKQDLLTEKRISLKTNNDMAKDFLKKIPMPDINSIADKVYKIIERKIDIEKDRRGL
jgi:hypothetical protein